MAAPVQSKILVTGGAGFVGTHICESVLQAGQQAVVVDVTNAETSSTGEKTANLAHLERVAQAVEGAQLSVYRADLRDERRLGEIVQQAKPTACIHAAALVMDRRSVNAATEFIETNVLGTQCLLNVLAQTPTVEHLVFLSSRSAVGAQPTAHAVITEDALLRPINPYGASKAAAEAFCYVFHKTSGRSLVICRLQPMYGPRCRPDMLPRRLLERIHAGLPIEKYGTGEAVRDWLYITDAVNGILAALEPPLAFCIVNLGTGVGTTVNQLIHLAEEVVGRPAVIKNVEVPAGDAHFGGLADITQAQRLLHWTPQVDLKTGLRRTFEYMRRDHTIAR